MDIEQIAALIDHTYLKPEGKIADIERLCREARQYGFCSVCVQPVFLAAAKKMLTGTDVKTCTVVGFPLGSNTIASKVFETKEMVEQGADEIDMVIQIGALKEKKVAYLEEEIKRVVAAADSKIVKVILETAYLKEDEIELGARIIEKAGADFAKTSTGFAKEGATLTGVAVLKRVLGDRVGIKAAGGIKTLADLEEFVKVGATRIGTSNGVVIMQEAGGGK